MKRYVLGLLVSLLPAIAVAQTNPAAQAARQWRQQHERAIVDEFAALLSIPNVAQDRENIQRNAEFITKMMQMRGISTRLVSVLGARPRVAPRPCVEIRRKTGPLHAVRCPVGSSLFNPR